VKSGEWRVVSGEPEAGSGESTLLTTHHSPLTTHHSPLATRRAVTLLEVLLVLTLLVTLASMAWPALKRPLSNQRLRKAADAVRIAWGRARVEAMSSGRTLVFRYEVEGDRYSIQSYAGAESSPQDESSDGLEDVDQYGNDPAVLRGREPKLPEGITFVSSETDEDTRAESLALDEGPSAAGVAGWSGPILFYPDGTSSTARLILKSEYDRCVELSLRGLTGVVNVSDPFSGEGR
jgi:Tfp pilus assembly protein FimT